MNLLIRIARPTDLDAIGSLLVVSYSSSLAAHYDDDLLVRALPHITKAQPDLLACGTYYVAETESGKLVGCGGWTAATPGSGEIAKGEAHLRHFAIHPHWIRRGIATRLLVRCFSDAKAFGICKLHCHSTLNAERFYQASGFKRVEPVDVPICPDLTFPCILMSREMA